MDGTEQRSALTKRRLWILLPAILLVLLSVVFLSIRAIRWVREKEETRLLTLVDREHPVEDDYNVEFTMLGEGQMLDSRCVDDLETMLADCRRAGGKPLLESSFRTRGAQERLYEQARDELTETGLSRTQAENELLHRVEEPGCSEHQLGLAVDIVEEGCELPREEQADTVTLRWLADNAWRYGFILRYPADRTELTGMAYRPWHFRYVGREAAGQIQRLDLTLEEYLLMFYSDENG